MGHWYRQDGSPCYEVPKAGGAEMRPTTLADARKLNLVPSVTTILSLISKPALEKWKTDQLLKAVYENPFRYGWDDDWDQHKRKLFAIAERVGREAAETGNQIHDALENYFLGNGVSDAMRSMCTPVIKLIDATFGPLQWIPEAYFAHPKGFGGKCDLHFKGNDKYPNGIILDFKTKSADDFSKVKAYDEQCQQLVAYREGFNLPKAECYNLFISTKCPGAMLLHKWDEKDCKKACKMFYSLLLYWKESNNVKE